MDGGESPDASGLTWDEVYEYVKTLQERLEGTLAGITDPRAVRMPGDQGRAVPIRKLRATAGSGTRNWDETVEGHLYFGEEWLRKHGIEPGHCRVARALGRQWSRRFRMAARYWWTSTGMSSASVQASSCAPVTGSLLGELPS